MNHMFEDCGIPGCTGETKKCGFKGCDRWHPNECAATKGEWLCTEHKPPEALSEQVIQFMILAEQDIQPKPKRPPAEIVKLRMRLIIEEALELLEAAGLDPEPVKEAKSKLFEAIDFYPTSRKLKMADWVDALADLDYVVEGARLAFGVFGKTIAAEVHKKNMEKFGPGGYRDEHGKWRKPPDWTPPDIERILREQGWEGDE